MKINLNKYKMKQIIPAVIFLIIIVSGCTKNKHIVLEFSNPADLSRDLEVVKIDQEKISELFSEFPEEKLPLFIAENDTLISQFIDQNEDGIPEEILIGISLDPNGSKEVKVEWLDHQTYPSFEPKTSIHFGKHEDPSIDIEKQTRLQTKNNTETAAVYQMEGPAWENNKVGFRNYFDLRNGMDIFGKITSDMVLNHVGLKKAESVPKDHNFSISYHELSDWGMDVLKVGNSLGAGSIAMEINDSLYRIGDNGTSTYEILYEGPLKSKYKFHFPEWQADGKNFDITQYVSITANEYCYKSSLLLNKKANGNFATGIVNMHSDSLIQFNAGNQHSAFLTHDKQAENNAYLGMAVLADNNLVISNGTTKDTGEGITETFFIIFSTSTDKLVEYRFYAFWENSNRSFNNPDFLKQELQNEAVKIENPIQIKKK